MQAEGRACAKVSDMREPGVFREGRVLLCGWRGNSTGHGSLSALLSFNSPIPLISKMSSPFYRQKVEAERDEIICSRLPS